MLKLFKRKRKTKTDKWVNKIRKMSASEMTDFFKAILFVELACSDDEMIEELTDEALNATMSRGYSLGFIPQELQDMYYMTIDALLESEDVDEEIGYLYID